MSLVVSSMRPRRFARTPSRRYSMSNGVLARNSSGASDNTYIERGKVSYWAPGVKKSPPNFQLAQKWIQSHMQVEIRGPTESCKEYYCFCALTAHILGLCNLAATHTRKLSSSVIDKAPFPRLLGSRHGLERRKVVARFVTLQRSLHCTETTLLATTPAST
jgi:hypothetical protein